jgi:serine phosphatase RsbU (regulator of sigma subunit)
VTAAGRVGTGQLLLKPGDRLVQHTDGVTDAIDESGRFFSEASEQVHRFSGGAPQADDITLLGYVGPRDVVET